MHDVIIVIVFGSVGGIIGTAIGMFVIMTQERLWDYSKRPGKWFR